VKRCCARLSSELAIIGEALGQFTKSDPERIGAVRYDPVFSRSRVTVRPQLLPARKQRPDLIARPRATSA
jgi:hypothetical protein